MRKLLSVLAIILVTLCIFADDSESGSLSSPNIANITDSVRTALPAKTGTPMLPKDVKIGQVVSYTESPDHETLNKMLREEYSFEWTESHIAEQERPTLVKLFGSWLSQNLPATNFLMSKMSINQDGSVVINVRIGNSCMAFVLKDSMIVSMKEL